MTFHFGPVQHLTYFVNILLRNSIEIYRKKNRIADRYGQFIDFMIRTELQIKPSQLKPLPVECNKMLYHHMIAIGMNQTALDSCCLLAELRYWSLVPNHTFMNILSRKYRRKNRNADHCRQYTDFTVIHTI